MNNLFDHFLKHIRLSLRQDPARDWMLLLATSIFILIGIIVWNMWAFSTVTSGGVIGVSATSTPPTFDQSALDAIHAVFDSRATEEAKYVSGEYSFSDPSQ